MPGEASPCHRTTRPKPWSMCAAICKPMTGCRRRAAALEHDLWYLGRIRPLPTPEYTWIEDSDWAEAWKAHFKALLVGRRLRVQPAWLPLPDDDRITLLIDPGMAFGTGTHPTTQLCLELLEDYVRPGDWLADLGCGSGILSIASARLGAARCLAYDTDLQAVEICQENAAVNSVQDQVAARVGSLPELLSDAEGLQAPQVILANIYLSVLCDMLDHGLEPLGGPGSYLVLSGILDEQEPELLAAARGTVCCWQRLAAVGNGAPWCSPKMRRPPNRMQVSLLTLVETSRPTSELDLNSTSTSPLVHPTGRRSVKPDCSHLWERDKAEGAARRPDDGEGHRPQAFKGHGVPNALAPSRGRR